MNINTQKKEEENRERNHHMDDWLLGEGRSTTFEKWMESLQDPRVRRARVYISDLVHSKGVRNYATPHQR